MKKAHVCPKCGGENVLKGKSLPKGWNIFGGSFSAVQAEQYVCFDCGYVELWIDPDSRAAVEVRQKLSKMAQRDREEKRRDDSWN